MVEPGVGENLLSSRYDHRGASRSQLQNHRPGNAASVAGALVQPVARGRRRTTSQTSMRLGDDASALRARKTWKLKPTRAWVHFPHLLEAIKELKRQSRLKSRRCAELASFQARCV